MLLEQQTKITASNTPVTFNLHGEDCMVLMDGTYTGFSFSFNLTHDGTILRPAASQLITDNSLQTGVQSPANSSAIAYRINSRGWPKLQVTPSALASGPVNVALDQTGIVFQPPLILSSLTGNQTHNNLNLTGGFQVLPVALTTNGAIPPHTPQTYVITKAGILADTLAAPTATVDDGVEITVVSTTANAHTITATGLLNVGTASVNLATFAANAGAGLTLMAYQGKWYVLCSVGITFS